VKRIHKYIDDVLSDKIVTCRFVKKAVERHVDDLKSGPDRGLYFDEKEAQKILSFYETLKLWEEPGAGEIFSLLPHWAFIVANLFGWKKIETGRRRFRKSYIETAKKSCKSTVMGGLAAYSLVVEAESGAQIYCAATKKEQSIIVWRSARNLLKRSDWASCLRFLQYSITKEDTFGLFSYLSKDDGADGKSTSLGIIDEYHQHTKSVILDSIETSCQSRPQPLLIIITTAGFNQYLPCYSEREYAAKILKGTVQDDSYFSIIYTLDTTHDWPDLIGLKDDRQGKKEDDWQDENVWIKANPGIEYGLPDREKIRAIVRQAIEMPTQINNVITKHFNIWTSTTERWVSTDLWDKNSGKVELQRYQRVWGGVDLSGVADLTSFVWVYNSEKKLAIQPYFWCTEAWLNDPTNKYAEQFRAWAEEKYITIQPGNALNFVSVRADILNVVKEKKLSVQSVKVDQGFDSHTFCQNLDYDLGGSDNFPKVGTGRMGSLLPAIDELERLLLDGLVINGNNPVLRFCISNTEMKRNNDGFRRPWKPEGHAKIDGTVATLFAVLQWLVEGGSTQDETYEPPSELIMF